MGAGQSTEVTKIMERVTTRSLNTFMSTTRRCQSNALASQEIEIRCNPSDRMTEIVSGSPLCEASADTIRYLGKKAKNQCNYAIDKDGAKYVTNQPCGGLSDEEAKLFSISQASCIPCVVRNVNQVMDVAFNAGCNIDEKMVNDINLKMAENIRDEIKSEIDNVGVLSSTQIRDVTKIVDKLNVSFTKQDVTEIIQQLAINQRISTDGAGYLVENISQETAARIVMGYVSKQSNIAQVRDDILREVDKRSDTETKGATDVVETAGETVARVAEEVGDVAVVGIQEGASVAKTSLIVFAIIAIAGVVGFILLLRSGAFLNFMSGSGYVTPRGINWGAISNSFSKTRVSN